MGFSTRSLNLLQAVPFVNKWQPLTGNSILRSPIGRCLLLFIVAAFTVSLFPTQSEAADSKKILLPDQKTHELAQKLIDTGSFALARNSKILAAYNPDASLVPASISKLITALAAFEQLGEEYRFKTDFFISDRNDLYIKGYGDPFLVSEEIERIVLSMKERGVTLVNKIYIDDSSYRLTGGADGAGSSLNPYDVTCGGLVVNFNTINIVINKNGTVSSGESQTPLLPIMARLGKMLKPGEYRINISSEPANVLSLTGQLFRAFLDKAGIKGSGPVSRRRAPEGTPLLIHYSSKKLPELIEGLMLYSNNFIANQIFLATGAARYGFPATWLKARRAVKDYISKNKKISGMNIQLVEGSGLSRNNRITARAMLSTLELFKPHAGLLSKKDGIMVKSGTLTGVYSYAGYLPSPSGLDSFVIILNQHRNTRDEIMALLKQIHAGS